MVARFAFAFAVLAVSSSARADQTQNGERIFKTYCASCHVVADGKAAPIQPHFIDLTLLLTKHSEADVRAWLAKAPVPKEGAPMCNSQLSDRYQQDAILAFLHQRSQPLAVEKAAPALARKPGERVVREKRAAKMVQVTRNMAVRKQVAR